MAASKPTSSLSKQRHILSTEQCFGTLVDDLGCCPFGYEAYPSQPECWVSEIYRIRSLIGFGNLVGSLSHPVLYLYRELTQRSPSSDFGENQLSRGLISLSLLLLSHLRIFQHPRVQSFTTCYRSFNLLKSRSPPLRVYCQQLFARFALGFPSPGYLVFGLAPDNNSQTHYAKGKQSHFSVLLHIVSLWFEVLFHSPSRGSFRLSLAVLVHYRLLNSIQPYPVVRTDSHRVSRAPCYLGFF